MCTLLAIESSCDDTSASVLRKGKILSNIISGQIVHQNYGGVVPELASRAHQKNIVPVVQLALEQAGIKKEELDAIAFTRGPGLLGSLLVGVSFSKSFALALNIPLIEVDHLQAHIVAHFIDAPKPNMPFLCLLVSGGHTLIAKVTSETTYEIVGRTIDDAAGEAFDKAAKILDLPYPGGPLIDKYAKEGNIEKFTFPLPDIPDLDFSFSGLKTSFLYFIRDNLKNDRYFIKNNLADICASYQHALVKFLLQKLQKASNETGIKEIGIAGGVAANSYLREQLKNLAKENNLVLHIPKIEYCTDNAAMIAIAAYYKYKKRAFASQEVTPYAKAR